jgi:hypothetical protein
MTYKQLLNELKKLPKERLEDTVTVYDPDRDDFCSINHAEVSTDDANDVLDPDHFYLVLTSYGI